jgi:hypothetical protein
MKNILFLMFPMVKWILLIELENKICLVYQLIRLYDLSMLKNVSIFNPKNDMMELLGI